MPSRGSSRSRDPALQADSLPFEPRGGKDVQNILDSMGKESNIADVYLIIHLYDCMCIYMIEVYKHFKNIFMIFTSQGRMDIHRIISTCYLRMRVARREIRGWR